MENTDQDTHLGQMEAGKIWLRTEVSAVWWQQRFTLQENVPQGWFSPG